MLSFNTNELTNVALKNTKEETAQYSLHVVGLVINPLNKTIIIATRALEHKVLGPDGTGLESSLVETADEGVRPALLDETTRGAGSDSPAAGGGRGA
jgi:hypothetical protein